MKTNPSKSSSSFPGLLLLLSGLLFAGLPGLAASYTWNGGSGDWSVAGNWTPSGPPGAGDTATINSGTATVNADTSVNTVNLGGGTLNGAAVLTVTNVMNWTGGTMSGSGKTVVAPGAQLNIITSSEITLANRTLENGGTVVWTGTVGLFGVSAVITNRPGALFEVRGDTYFFPAGNTPNPRFDNAGTFRKTTGVGTTTFMTFPIYGTAFVFNNFGAVEIHKGSISAVGGYTSSPGAVLHSAIGGAAVGTGYGQLQVSGAVALNGALRVTLTNGFYPNASNTFTVLTAGSRSGTFTSFIYPTNDIPMLMSNTANFVIVLVTNAPPVAQNITVGAARGETVTFQVIGGKHAPIDPEGHSLSVTAVGMASSGTSGFTASNVTYTASGTIGTNTFTYTVTDVAGGTDTKTVTVVVHDPQGFNRLSPAAGSVANGVFALTYLGIPNYSYALDHATNLTPPIVWTGLVTNQAATNGYLTFSVTNSEPVNFFRTRHAP